MLHGTMNLNSSISPLSWLLQRIAIIFRANHKHLFLLRILLRYAMVGVTACGLQKHGI